MTIETTEPSLVTLSNKRHTQMSRSELTTTDCPHPNALWETVSKLLMDFEKKFWKILPLGTPEAEI
jgi:hypothetical protein